LSFQVSAGETEDEIYCDIHSVHLIEINETSINSKMKDISSDYPKKIKIDISIISDSSDDWGFLNIVGVNEPINLKGENAEFRFFINKIGDRNVDETYNGFKFSKNKVLSANTTTGNTFILHKTDSSFSIIKINEFYENPYKKLFYGKCDL